MATNPINIRIAAKVNGFLDEAQKFYSTGFSSPLTRTVILDKAWRQSLQARHPPSGASINDTVSVCAEHYLYARYQASKGISEAVIQQAAIVGYVVVKHLPKKWVAKWLSSDGVNPPSDYEYIHTEWENRGLADGQLDRGSMSTPGRMICGYNEQNEREEERRRSERPLP